MIFTELNSSFEMSNVYLTTGRRHIDPCFVLFCKIDPMVHCLLKIFVKSVYHQDIFSILLILSLICCIQYTIFCQNQNCIMWNIPELNLWSKHETLTRFWTRTPPEQLPILPVLYVNSCLKIHEQWFNNAQWGYERQRYAFYDWQNGLRHQFRHYLVRQGQAICFK